MNACSVPIPPGRDRDEGREALRHLDEEDVPEALVDAERTEEEPDRDEAQRPVGGLPRGDPAQVLRPVAQDGEALEHALLELVDVRGGPRRSRRRRRSRARPAGRPRTPGWRRRSRSRSPAGCPACRAGQDAERQRVDEDRRRHRRVEDREHEQRRGERRCTCCRERRGGRGRA